jgi:ATP-binding protein involved in chromosome partitioning
MSYFLCLPLRGRSETLSHHGARQKVERLGTEFHGDVPLDLKARETSDGRSPITVSEPDNPQVLVFCHIAGRICEKVTGAHAEQRATRIVIHQTSIKRVQPKLPVSRKGSGKPTMNGNP